MNSTNPLRTTALALTFMAALVLGGPAAAEVVGSEGWARATAPGSSTAVGYLVLTNTGGAEAKLLKIVSPVSDRVMLHRSSIDSQGVARLWPLAKLEIAPGDTVRFEPRGMQVTLMDLKTPLVAGQKVPLQLTFEGEPEITVLLEVK
jgi:copper(I)-binding protein